MALNFPPWFLQLSAILVSICGLMAPVFVAVWLIDKLLLYIMRRRKLWKIANEFRRLAEEVNEISREKMS